MKLSDFIKEVLNQVTSEQEIHIEFDVPIAMYNKQVYIPESMDPTANIPSRIKFTVVKKAEASQSKL